MLTIHGRASFHGGGSVQPTTPCGSRWGVHLLASFDFFTDSINISAAATSTANKMLTTARFIVGPPFRTHAFYSLHDFPTNPSNIRRGKKKWIKKKGERMMN